MISEERKAWILKNKAHGDIKAAVDNLNKKGKKVKLNVAHQVVSNGLWGEFGKAVWDELERVIKKRIAQLQKEKELYAASQ